MATSQKLGTAELLFRSARRMGLQPSWITPNGLILIHTINGEKYLNITGSPFNSQLSASLAKDKYFARLIMERHNLPNIPFARPQTQIQAQAFLDEHTTVVVKPTGGAGARDIHIVTHMRDLAGLDIQKYIFEKYIPGKEMRYLVLNDEVVAVYESQYGLSVDEFRTLQVTSYPQTLWDPALIDISRRIAAIFDLRLAAVDFLIDAGSYAYVLEVNTTPDIKWFHAPTAGPAVDIATMFIKAQLGDKTEKDVLPRAASLEPVL